MATGKKAANIKPSWTLKQIRERVEMFAADLQEEEATPTVGAKRTHIPADFTDHILAKVDPDAIPSYLPMEVERNPFLEAAEAALKNRQQKKT